LRPSRTADARGARGDLHPSRVGNSVVASGWFLLGSVGPTNRATLHLEPGPHGLSCFITRHRADVDQKLGDFVGADVRNHPGKDVMPEVEDSAGGWPIRKVREQTSAGDVDARICQIRSGMCRLFFEG